MRATRGGTKREAWAVVCLTMASPAPVRAADVVHTEAGVIVTRATNECFSSVVRATGYIVPRATAVVMFNAPGFRITEVSAKEGDTIKAGDQVAVVVPSAAPADATGDQVTRIPIRSPASGVVLRTDASIGMLTSATASPLATLAIDGELEALVDIPSVHVLELSAGQVAHATMDDGRDFGGHVRVVPLEINRATQVGQARISIDSEQSLKMGRFIHVAIDASRSCGVGVPRAALMHESDGVRLQVVKDKTIETRVVQLGLLSDTDAEVKSGVAEGELVVGDAGTSLRDGDKVKPIFSDLQEVQ